MSDGSEAKCVKALFSFKASNNDELCFQKGDIVTLTQMIDGGWWEGTLDGKTGWFPSNYVKEWKQDIRAGAKSPGPAAKELVMNKRESMIFYRNVVLQSLIDTERTYVNDLQTLLQSYLRLIFSSNILNAVEYSHLCGNLEEIMALHQNLLAALDECAEKAVQQQQVGAVFMQMATQLKTMYDAYCSNHPKAVAVLQNKKDSLNQFMESHGAPSPGIMTLTTSLSKPFARLDKYSSLLKELERHTDESHLDRGDTQRAISIYRDMSMNCSELRKQKELENEILGSVIKGWEGEDISKLGEVLILSHVRVHSENGEKRERLCLIFPGLLIMLSVSPRLSGYTYQGRLPLSGTTVTPLDDDDNFTYAFQITGSMIDKKIVSCPSAAEKVKWVEVLRQQAKHGPIVTGKPQSLQISTSQPSISTMSQAKTAHVVHQPFQRNTTWTMSCLRPCPPLRPSVLVREEVSRSPRSGRKILGAGRRKPAERAFSEEDYVKFKRIDDSKTLEDDALILKVVEGYCTSAKARQTVNSSLLDSPQVLIAEDEKIIVEEVKGNQTIVEEKSLVDTVYSLRDQVKDLKQEHQRLRKDLEDEKRCRKRLEIMVRKSMKSLADTVSINTNWEEDHVTST